MEMAHPCDAPRKMEVQHLASSSPPVCWWGELGAHCGVSAHFSVPVWLPWRSPSAAPTSQIWGKEKHRVSRAISCISWEAPRGRAGFCLKSKNKRRAVLVEVTALLPSPAQHPAHHRSPFPGGLLPSWRFSCCCRQSPVWLRNGLPPALGRSRRHVGMRLGVPAAPRLGPFAGAAPRDVL